MVQCAASKYPTRCEQFARQPSQQVHRKRQGGLQPPRFGMEANIPACAGVTIGEPRPAICNRENPSVNCPSPDEPRYTSVNDFPSTDRRPGREIIVRSNRRLPIAETGFMFSRRRLPKFSLNIDTYTKGKLSGQVRNL